MLDSQSMSSGIKLRLAAFVLAIAGMVGLIAWTAQSAWRRGSELRDRLTTVQLKSFQIADRIQQTILSLNNYLLRYSLWRDPTDWVQFEKASKQLDNWIDEQRPSELTERETNIHDLINTNYDFYTAAAREIADKVRTNGQRAVDLKEFAKFETNSQVILKLGFELADAHRESMTSFLRDSSKALTYLRFLLGISLALLLLAVGGLAFVVYRELIAPLRVKLVESQALMERQEKLASLGMLAAGVAHEIRNPLTAIKAWLFIQQKHLEPGTQEHADAEVISNEISRLDRLVKDVLLFARPSEPHFETVQAEQPLRDVQILMAPQLAKAGINLAFENSVSASVRIDPQQIKQVLINLVQNA